jgi:putative transposase
VPGAPASLIGSELSSLLGSDPSQIHTYEVDNEARQQALGLPLWQEDREVALFTRVRGETVRKGVLREWLGRIPSMRKAYQTDLSDAEWSYVEPHLPAPKAPGRPRLHPLREILDAVFYVLKSGCQWRLLPHDFPPWKTVHHYLRTWRKDGTWERIHAALRQRLRVRLKRDPLSPAQEWWIPRVGQEHRCGRRRACLRRGQEGQGQEATSAGGHRGLRAQSPAVHSAKVMDYEGIKPLLEGADQAFPRLRHLWVDAGYRAEDKGAEWVKKTLGWSVDLVERPKKPAPEEVLMRWAREWAEEGVAVDWQKLLPPKGFVVLPRRWVVERTIAWIDHNRRMSLGITSGWPPLARRSSTWR